MVIERVFASNKPLQWLTIRLIESKTDLGRSEDDAAILDALRMHISPEAEQSLDAVAATSVAIDASRPDPES